MVCKAKAELLLLSGDFTQSFNQEQYVFAGDKVKALHSSQLLQVVEVDELSVEAIASEVILADQSNEVHQEAEVSLFYLA